MERVLSVLSGDMKRSNARKVAAAKKPSDAIRQLLRRDYVRCLRRHLSYNLVRTMLAEFSRIFPGFNTRSVALMTTEGFGAIAARRNLHLAALPYNGPEGMALRGFYVAKAEGLLKRPLIFVNTAHHPLAVSASFIHELAHHVTSDILGPPAHPLHMFFDADYPAHLREPSELLADTMVSLAAYSAAKARQIFPSEWGGGLVARAMDPGKDALEQVYAHLQEVYGLDLTVRLPPKRRFNYLAGMIHWAKLRWALMVEYDL